jgi:hypothetical protein
MAVALTNIFASTVDEFTENAAAVFGAGTLGETKPRLSFKWSLDENSKIASATVTLSITATTAHWAGPGLSGGKHKPQPDAANKAAIVRVEALNKAHEQKHIDTYQSTFDAKKTAAEKRLIGMTESEAGAVRDELGKALRDACEALHATEGLVTVTTQGATITVTVGPSGPGGCD